jgi:hypothetical protein
MPPMQTCTVGAAQTYCTDVSRDPGNCGGCGRVCPPNAICTSGICQGGGFYPGVAPCPGTGGAPMCTNLYSDPANCGACGNVCQAGMGCYGGACGTAPPPPMCPQGATTCTDATGKMYCTQISGDPSNCGGCGNVCPAGYACQNATCVAGTPPPDGGTTTAPDGGAPPP